MGARVVYKIFFLLSAATLINGLSQAAQAETVSPGAASSVAVASNAATGSPVNRLQSSAAPETSIALGVAPATDVLDGDWYLPVSSQQASDLLVPRAAASNAIGANSIEANSTVAQSEPAGGSDSGSPAEPSAPPSDTTAPGASPESAPPESVPSGAPASPPPSAQPFTPDLSTPSPGRTTRSGPSYIGIGGNIGLGSGDTALGEGSLSIFSKVGLTSNISVRPAILVSDSPTILLPVTLDFFPLTTVGDRFRISPYLGIGPAIATGNDFNVDLLLTGGIDVPITDRFTATAAVNATVTGDPAVGLTLGIGYNF